MTSCDHSIFDYETYGMWGAILAEGETIFYNFTKKNCLWQVFRGIYRIGTLWSKVCIISYKLSHLLDFYPFPTVDQLKTVLKIPFLFIISQFVSHGCSCGNRRLVCRIGVHVYGVKHARSAHTIPRGIPWDGVPD